VTERLRDELFRGRWSGKLPAIHHLSAELEFFRKPVEQALLLLEKKGAIDPQRGGSEPAIAAKHQAKPYSSIGE